MNNRFFQLSSKNQRKFQFQLILVFLVGLLTFGLILFLISPNLLYLCILIFPILITVIAPFFDVPAQIEKEELKYHSLFLFAEKKKGNLIKLHGGTLFDYYFVFEKEMTKKERTKLILLEYLKGLKNLVQTTDQEVIIQGTTYFINERTANKLGLKRVATNELQKLILYFNFINITCSISFVNKSLIFPNLNNIKSYEGKIRDIKAREHFINELIKKLK